MTKAATARTNGAKSNGPITEQGKAISARNAETHGLTSSRIVLPYESQADYDKLEADFIARFQPADEVERDLVHEMAAARWRLRRIEAMEAATFRKVLREQQELQGPEADPIEVQAATYAQYAESKTFRTLSRHQAQLRRSFEKAWKELDRLQAPENEEIQNEPTADQEDAGLAQMIHALMAAPLPEIDRQAIRANAARHYTQQTNQETNHEEELWNL